MPQLLPMHAVYSQIRTRQRVLGNLLHELRLRPARHPNPLPGVRHDYSRRLTRVTSVQSSIEIRFGFAPSNSMRFSDASPWYNMRNLRLGRHLRIEYLLWLLALPAQIRRVLIGDSHA